MKSRHPRRPAAQPPSRLAAQPLTCSPSLRKMILLILYSLLILGGSLIPMDGSSKTFAIFMDLKPMLQNLLHIPVFALLAILLLQVLDGYGIQGIRKWLTTLTSILIFGILNEMIQLAVPGRYPGLLDILLNSFGTMVGFALYFYFEKRHHTLFHRLVCK